VISKYYSRITEKRLATLLDLDIAETEKHLSRLVVNKSVYARINRLNGVVVFRKAQTPSDVLNSWGSDVESLLKIVENTCHLIQRENMVHKVEK
jgi:26S proteasome regulatory subunit N5